MYASIMTNHPTPMQPHLPPLAILPPPRSSFPTSDSLSIPGQTASSVTMHGLSAKCPDVRNNVTLPPLSSIVPSVYYYDTRLLVTTTTTTQGQQQLPLPPSEPTTIISADTSPPPFQALVRNSNSSSRLVSLAQEPSFPPLPLAQQKLMKQYNNKQCPVCGKICSRPSTLKTHYLIHTGDTPFKCTWGDCTKSFNVKSNMLRHLKSHQRKGKRKVNI